jgi:hypothetical protein
MKSGSILPISTGRGRPIKRKHRLSVSPVVLSGFIVFILAVIANGAGARLGQNAARIPGIGGNPSGPPTGTAPVISSLNQTGGLMQGDFLLCQSGTTSCGGAINENVASGDTEFIIMSGDPPPGNTMTASFINVSSPTCGSLHAYGGSAQQTQLCYGVTTGITSGNMWSCSRPANTLWTNCIFFTVHCASTCVLDQGPVYQDTAGTGSSATISGGSITTTYQLNELIIGAFTTNCSGCNGVSGNYTAGSGYAMTGAGGCNALNTACGQKTNGSNGTNAMFEYLSTTNVGTYQATATMPTSKNTVGLTFAIR